MSSAPQQHGRRALAEAVGTFSPLHDARDPRRMAVPFAVTQGAGLPCSISEAHALEDCRAVSPL